MHFLEVCEGLEEVRRRYGFLRAEDVLSFGAADWEDVKGYLEEIWEIRRGALAHWRVALGVIWVSGGGAEALGVLTGVAF